MVAATTVPVESRFEKSTWNDVTGPFHSLSVVKSSVNRCSG